MRFNYGPCPDCGAKLTADEVDIGAGLIPCGPIGCDECQAYYEGDVWIRTRSDVGECETDGDEF